MTDNEDEEIYIGCMTVQNGLWNPSSVAKGCIVGQCCVCGIDVNVSPTSQKFLAENPTAKFICVQCLPKQIAEKKAEGEPINFAGPVPGAIQEALDNIASQKENKQ